MKWRKCRRNIETAGVAIWHNNGSGEENEEKISINVNKRRNE
jgi:hypothetical protein